MHKVGGLEAILADSSEDKSIGIFFLFVLSQQLDLCWKSGFEVRA